MTFSDSPFENDRIRQEPSVPEPTGDTPHAANIGYPSNIQTPDAQAGLDLDPPPAEDMPSVADDLPRGESGDRPGEESAEAPGPPSGGDVRGDEAGTDLREAQEIIRVVVIELIPVDGPGKAVTLEVRAEADAVARLLAGIAGVRQSGGSPSAGQVCAVFLRVEMLQASAEEAVRHADGDVKEVLEKVLGKIPMIGQKLVSMSLHLFPVKEWSLGCEVSAVLVKGSISVTFGK